MMTWVDERTHESHQPCLTFLEPVELDLEPANLLEELRDELLVLTCEGSSIVAKNLGKRVDGLFLPCAALALMGSCSLLSLDGWRHVTYISYV